MIQGIFLSPNSNINSQDILWHYVNLAKSDETLADSSWLQRIYNTVLQVELAQHDGIKTTGLTTKSVRPDGKNHLKTIKQVTNEFDAATNEIDNHHSDTKINSVESKVSTERETDPRDWKDQDIANFISSAIPNANIKPTLYRSKEYEEDISPPILRKKRSNSPSESPSRQSKTKKGRSSHSSEDNDPQYNEKIHYTTNSADKRSSDQDSDPESIVFDNTSILKVFLPNSQIR